MLSIFRLKNIRNKINPYITFFISFLLVLLITVILGSISYYYFFNQAKKQIDMYNISILNQTQKVLDEKLYSIYKLSLEIDFNSSIQNVLSNSSSLDETALYNIFKAKNEISHYKNVNKFIDDIFVYINRIDSVISDSTRYDSEMFYDSVLSYDGLEFNEWKELLAKRHFQEYLPVMKTMQDSQPKEVITYLQTLPYRMISGNQALGTLIILIDKAKIDELLYDVNILDRGAAFILDGKNQIIYSVGDEEVLKKINNDGLIFDKSDSKPGKHEMVVFRVPSKVSDWVYVSVVPTTALEEDVRFVKNISILVIIIELIVGIMVAFLLTRINLLPLKKAVGKIWRQVKGDENVPKTSDHIRLIEEITYETLRNSQNLKLAVNQMQPMVRANIMTQLLKGIVQGGSDIKETFSCLENPFKYNHFSVLMMCIEDFNGLEKNDSIPEQALIKFIVKNIVEELFNSSFIAYTIDMDYNHIALLVNSDTDSDACRKQIIEYAVRTQNIVMEKFSGYVSIGISGFHEGLKGISTSYQEAVEALEYRYIRGYGSTIVFDDICNMNQIYLYPIKTEIHLINSVKSGDYAKTSEILQEIIVQNVQLCEQSIEIIQCLIFNIISTAMKVLNDLNIEVPNVFGERFHPVKTLTDCRTIDEMYRLLQEVYRKICDYINNQKKCHNTDLKQQIIQYIEDHFAENSLSLGSIADHFSLSISYLSIFFKDQIGENFISHVNKMRLEKAKQLLMSTNMPAERIAQQVGYANGSVLARNFKKYEGTTPGKFRENIS